MRFFNMDPPRQEPSPTRMGVDAIGEQQADINARRENRPALRVKVLWKMLKLIAVILLFLVWLSEASITPTEDTTSAAPVRQVLKEVPSAKQEVPSVKRRIRTKRIVTRDVVTEPRQKRLVPRYRHKIRAREVLNLVAIEKPIETIVSAMTYGLLKGARSFDVQMRSGGSGPHHFKIDVAK
ncbi:hypothetical protein OSTOST_04840 [Ostertagia ostertagi]